MTNSIFIKIITPLKTEFKGDVSYIEIPSIAGIIGIYANHIPLISALSNGIIKLHSLSGETHQFEINGGFLRLKENKCVISIKSTYKLNKTA
jgi:F-type H+-transporting ATPase subunit epsilon